MKVIVNNQEYEIDMEILDRLNKLEELLKTKPSELGKLDTSYTKENWQKYLKEAPWRDE